jgi:hypothetical protein
MNTAGPDLTALNDEEVAYINGTADIWSFDSYTADFVTSPPGGIDACASNTSHPLWPNCVVNTNVQSDGWLNGQASMTSPYIAPQYGYVWNTLSAVTAVAVGRILFAGAQPLVILQDFSGLEGDWAVSLFSFMSIALWPVPFLLFRYGKIWRERSRFVGVDRRIG